MNFKLKSTMITLSTTLLMLSLSGCKAVGGLSEGDKVNYKNGQNTTSYLELPPNVNKQDLPIPFVAPDGQTFSQFVQQKNQGQNGKVLTDSANVRIERDGQRRWLVVNKSPSEVWPQIEQFWFDLGFKLETNSPDTGIMETNWLENKKNAPNDALRKLLSSIVDFVFSSDQKDRFKTRLEFINGSTEIYVTHQTIEEQFSDAKKESTKWYNKTSDPEVEAEVLRKMVLSLGLNKQQADYLAKEYQKIPAKQEKNNVAASNAAQMLTELQLPTTTANAWRVLGIGLDRAGFMVENRDAGQMSYKIRYLDPSQFNQKVGFFARLVKGQKIDDVRKSKLYTLKVSASSNGTDSKINVLDLDNVNAAINSQIQHNILSAIKERL